MTLSIKGNLVENDTEEAPTNAEFNNARCSILSNEPIKNNDLISDFEKNERNSKKNLQI